MSKVVGNTRKAVVSKPRKAPPAPAPVQRPTVLKPNKTSLNRLRKEQLAKELEVRGQDATGNKDVLVARLLNVLTDPEVANVRLSLPKGFGNLPEAVDKVAVIDTVNKAAPEAVDINEKVEVAPQPDTTQAKFEQLQAVHAQVEVALSTANAALAEAQAKEEADRARLAEVMAAVEQLKKSGLAEQEEAAALAQQLMQQLKEAQEESSALQAQQQQLTAHVNELSAAVQGKDASITELQAELQIVVQDKDAAIAGLQAEFRELIQEKDISITGLQAEFRGLIQEKDVSIAGLQAEFRELMQEKDVSIAGLQAEFRELMQEKDASIAQLQSQLQDMSELSSRVQGVQFNGKELTLELAAPQTEGQVMAAPPAPRRIPATSAGKNFAKDHACAGLLVCAAVGHTWNTWQSIRSTFAPGSRILVDAAGVMMAASSMLLLLH